MPRRYRRRFRRRRPRIARSVVPPSRLVRVRCSDYNTLTSTSGAIGTISPYVNGFIKPFGAGNSTQPLYVDQLKTHYRSAVCLGSKITVQFHNNTTTTPVAQVVGLYRYPYDVGAVTWTYEYFREASFPGRQRITTSDMDVVTFSMKTSCKKYFGVADMTDGNEFLVDLENETECSKLGNYGVWMQSLDQSTTSSCQIVTTIEYVLLVKDPYTPARSTAA